MGKGDKKSRKGKIFMGSYGKTRPGKTIKKVTTPKKDKAQPKKEKIVKEVKEVKEPIVVNTPAQSELFETAPEAVADVNVDAEAKPKKAKKTPAKEVAEGEAKPKARKTAKKKEDGAEEEKAE